MAPPAVKLSVGSRCTIAADTDLRGEIVIGSGTVIHPKAIVHALNGTTIEIGRDCIIEEGAQIICRPLNPIGANSSEAQHTRMRIGDSNLFEVGCRVEASKVGSRNTFEPKCRVTDMVTIGDFCLVGAGCLVVPPPTWTAPSEKEEQKREEQEQSDLSSGLYRIPDRTVVYGNESRWRTWSGEGVRQADALHAKHLDYLRLNIPKFHKLRLIQ